MNIEIRAAKNRVLDAGKSNELDAALRSIAEATLPGGTLKYAPRVCHQLAQIIVCRNYAKAILQLCHLINAARACGPGRDNYEDFFFDGQQATAHNFRAAFERGPSAAQLLRSGIACTPEGITISYGKAVFDLSFSRMPLLAALLEFLIGIHGYPAVDDLFAEMFSDLSGQTALQTTAGKISRLTYHYLSHHLPTAQNTAKFRAILSFLEERTNDGTALIDDDTILEFWSSDEPAADSQLGDFRAFRTVFKAFVAVLRALELSETRGAVGRAVPVGSDAAAGETDPDSLSGILDLPGQWRSPLPLLEEEPVSRIKLLTNREKESLRPLMDLGPLSRDLPLSLLRAETFGKQQSRITQALRQKRGRQDLDRLTCCSDTESYALRRETYGDLQTGLQRLMKAALHALLQGRQMATARNVVALPKANPAEIFERVREDAGIAADPWEIDSVLQDARKAFDKVSRKGFDEGGLGDPVLLEGFRVGAGVLQAIAEQLEAYLNRVKQIDQSATDLECRYRHDIEVFRCKFERLYGEGS